MCGRFTLTSTDDLVRDLALASAPPALAPRFNIAPTQDIAVVANHAERRLELFRWGLVPRWAKDPKIGSRLINARSETLADKPAFRAAYERRRCLVLADGFYEWKREGKRRVPHYIRRVDKRGFAMAGLWERWSDPSGAVMQSTAIITAPANRLVASIHHRMPVIVWPGDYDRWLHPEPMPPEMLQDLLGSARPDEYEMFPVSARVGKVTHDDPACIVAAPEQKQLF